MKKLGAHAILLKRITEEKERITKSGIIIPSTIKQNKVKGIVVETGMGTPNKPMEAKVGDTITYESLVAKEIKKENQTLDLIDSLNCLFIEEFWRQMRHTKRQRQIQKDIMFLNL